MQGENWIDDVLSEVTDVETPTSWIWWSLVTAISACAANNYHLRAFNGQHIVKANLYTILYGDSGLGKSYPVNLAKAFVAKADCTRVIHGRSSIQAIVSEIGTSRSRENGKPPFDDSRCFIVNGELSSAIIADVESLFILTDLYDGSVLPTWTNMLKGDGIKGLKDPYVTALFGTSPAGFYNKIPQANIDGGYIGRNLVVYEEHRSRDIDLFGIDNGSKGSKVNDYLVPKYVDHLIAIGKGKGEIIPSDTAKAIFNPWRLEWRRTQKRDTTGFLNRVPEHVLKVAMCLCLGRYSSEGVINEFDIREAIDRVTGLIYANKMTSAGQSDDPITKYSKVVLNELIRADNQQLTRKLLLSRCYPLGLCDTPTLDRIIDNFLEIGYVERERYVAGSKSDWIIKLAGEPLANYKKYLEDQKRRK
jgi:hypothetical protein